MLQFLCLGLSQVKTVEFSANQGFIEPIPSADSPANQLAEYQVSANLLSQALHIQVLGSGTAGSVAAVFLRMKDGIWLTVGSDHEDFTARTYSMAVAKQLCPKVLAVGGVLYRSTDVVPQPIAPKSFLMQLFGPILNRTIQHRYDVECF